MVEVEIILVLDQNGDGEILASGERTQSSTPGLEASKSLRAGFRNDRPGFKDQTFKDPL